MADMMTFPDTVEEFMEQYKMTDTKQVYSNGIEYVPIFRMKQWFEQEKAQLFSEDATSDPISRQAALDIFDDYNVSVENGELEAYSRDRKRMCELPPVQPEPQWIPVEREFPEDYTDVLVWFEYFRYGDYNCLYQTHGIGTYVANYNSWTINHESGWKDLRVIAWMPLPKIYKPNNK